MRVVVIGAGVAGLAIGWRLAQAGAKVTVLERAQVGNGATSVSAGMIAAAAETGERISPEAAFARRASLLWPDFAREVEAQSGVQIGYRKNGALLLRLPGEAAASTSLEFLDPAKARAMEPLLAENIAGALWAPDEAQVISPALCRALAVAFVRAGGQVQSNETAVRFEHDGRKLLGVVTPFTTHHADVTILAAGAWSSRLAGLHEFLPPVTPVKGEIAVLKPPPGKGPALGAALPQRVIWGNGVYAAPRPDCLLIGATMELAGFDTSVSEKALAWLYRKAVAVLPGLKDWRLAGHWAGLRPCSPDGLPLLGETGLEGLYVAGGQYRNGILFAPAVAEVMSRLVLERVTEPAFDPRRFAGTKPPAPLVAETPHGAETGEAGEWRTGF
jgi:glycine oxidase